MFFTRWILQPVSPTLVASLDLPTNPPGIISPSMKKIYPAGHYAYVIRTQPSPHYCDGDLVLVDISNPNAPFVARWFYTGIVDDLFAQGDDLYLTYHGCNYGLVSSDLSRYDISDPANPIVTFHQMVKLRGTAGPYAAGIAVDGDSTDLGVTDYPDYSQPEFIQPLGLREYYISDPLTMTLKAFYPTPGQTPNQIELLDDALYAYQVSDGNDLFGIQVFYGLGSESLVQDNFYPTVQARDIRVSKDYFYVLGDYYYADQPGLYILANPGKNSRRARSRTGAASLPGGLHRR